MDTLAEDILLCIFDGELTRFVISEPKTGLRFGAADHEGGIVLRSLKEEDFGVPVKDAKVDLGRFADSNGRINITGLAEEMERLLGSRIKSPEFAFELIAVAKRAEFLKGGEWFEESDRSDVSGSLCVWQHTDIPEGYSVAGAQL